MFINLVNVANAQVASKLVEKNPALIGILEKINDNIISPIVSVLFILAFVMFVYGMFGMISSGDDSEKRKDGKNSILWGVVGMAIMLSVYGILNLIADTLKSLGVKNPFG